MAQTLERLPSISEYEEALLADAPLWAASRTAVTHKWRIDWSEAGMLLLMIACMALAIYRLAWDIQP